LAFCQKSRIFFSYSCLQFNALPVLSAAALETGDAAYVAKDQGVVARAKGMTEIAHKIEFSPEELWS
jgi:DNA-binding phage protein